jgi:hypothetical protein
MSPEIRQEAKMGWNSHIDAELSERLEEVIEGGFLDEDKTALGIAKLVKDGGLDVLSEKQRYVYDKYVEPKLYEV